MPKSLVNGNGAGDNFLAGFVTATMLEGNDSRRMDMKEACAFASLVALKHVDVRSRDDEHIDLADIAAEAVLLGRNKEEKD